MKPLTVVTPYISEPFFEKTLLSFMKSALVERVVIVSQEPIHFKMPKCHVLVAGPLLSQETLRLIVGETRTKYLLLITGTQQISMEREALEKILELSLIHI